MEVVKVVESGRLTFLCFEFEYESQVSQKSQTSKRSHCSSSETQKKHFKSVCGTEVFLQRNALEDPQARYHLYMDPDEDPKTCMRVLEEINLKDSIVIDVVFTGFW